MVSEAVIARIVQILSHTEFEVGKEVDVKYAINAAFLPQPPLPH